MKNVQDWVGADILSLPSGEFDWLEGKGVRSIDISNPTIKIDQVKNLLSKAISAFANSGGGYLILGVQDPGGGWRVDDGGVPTCLKGRSTREWLEDLIPHLVDPTLRKFNVYEISEFETSSGILDGRAVYVVQIEDSEQAPHQAIDKVYYGRVGGKSRPLGHRFVLDILGRRTHPRFEVSASIITSQKEVELNGLSFPHLSAKRIVRNCEMVIMVKNIGGAYAKYVNVFIDIPSNWFSDTDKSSFVDKGKEIDGVRFFSISKSNTRRDVVDVSSGPGYCLPKYGSSWFDPIFPGLYFNWKLELSYDGFIAEGMHSICWSIHADNARLQQGCISECDIDIINRS
ncbi:AlbA family DNA-binding domain-containing protein [Chromobacterium violaceum]